MTLDEAKTLKAGDRILHKNNSGDRLPGTIARVEVDWGHNVTVYIYIWWRDDRSFECNWGVSEWNKTFWSYVSLVSSEPSASVAGLWAGWDGE